MCRARGSVLLWHFHPHHPPLTGKRRGERTERDREREEEDMPFQDQDTVARMSDFKKGLLWMYFNNKQPAIIIVCS